MQGSEERSVSIRSGDSPPVCSLLIISRTWCLVQQRLMYCGQECTESVQLLSGSECRQYVVKVGQEKLIRCWQASDSTSSRATKPQMLRTLDRGMHCKLP